MTDTTAKTVPAKTQAPTRAPSKKKEPAAVLSSETIAQQTEAFLKAGGVIDKVKSGVSGHQNLAGPKHITLGNKPTA
ncbi:MAG: hypothetical protein VR73_12930 [Gammaproteobacteria bacterium BRH_c0]|nr:MAG: hypothetical protein VR73_12930 [Gammaproteobacteria bacterium BRH_c0]